MNDKQPDFNDTARHAFIDNLSPGDQVRWEDPDSGLCSGLRTIASIMDDPHERTEGTVVEFSDGSQCFLRECE